MKRLVFDTTDANTILDSDSVGAFLRASDGTLLTHTDVGGKKALDVRVAEGINVEVDLDFADDSVTAHQGGSWTVDVGNTVTVQATDLDIRDLDAAQDNVAISDGTDVLAINADGSINVGNTVTVQATDLDIRDLTQADEITVFQGTSPWVVSATDLDIRDLDAAQDSVQSNLFDGAGNAISSTSGALDVYVTGSDPLTVNDAALANTAIATASNVLGVANTAENVVASPLSNRKYLFIYNAGNRDVYVGATGVTAANGYPLPPEAQMILRAGPAIDIEWVGPNTSQVIKTLELS